MTHPVSPLRPVSDELSRRRQPLSDLRYNDAGPRLLGLLEWFRSQPQIMRIIDVVKGQVNVNELLKDCNRRNPPSAKTPEDIAAVGIYLIEQCAGGKKIHGLAYELGIAPVYDSGANQDWADAAVSRFIDPAIDLIESDLRDAESAASVEQVVQQRLVWAHNTTFSRQFPQTGVSLQRIAEQLSSAGEAGSWFNVGNSCREALKTFVAEVRKELDIELPMDTKAGDVKAILRGIIGSRAGQSRFKQTLEDLVAAVWDHTQSIIHRKTATRLDAERVYVWTALVMLEVAEHLSSSNVSTEG